MVNKAKDTHRMELRLRDISQLFNSMDPSPFNEKDLDHDAEDFIVSWALEFPAQDSIALRIYLEQWPEEQNILVKNPQNQIPEAVHHYFSYRKKLTHMELSRLFKQGRTSLLIGLTFLICCMVLIQFFLSSNTESTWLQILRESLTIAGWVAMWKPMNIYLYDWWPLRRREQVFEKLSKMPIEVLHKK